MDRPIEVGDLVMVVKPRHCCGETSGIGVIFRVASFTGRANCSNCGVVYGLYAELPDFGKVDVDRLIRIDPPALAYETRQDERLTA